MESSSRITCQIGRMTTLQRITSWKRAQFFILSSQSRHTLITHPSILQQKLREKCLLIYMYMLLAVHTNIIKTEGCLKHWVYWFKICKSELYLRLIWRQLRSVLCIKNIKANSSGSCLFWQRRRNRKFWLAFRQTLFCETYVLFLYIWRRFICIAPRKSL